MWILFAFIFGALVGWKLREIIAKIVVKNLQKQIDNIEESLEQQVQAIIEKSSMHIYIEKYDNSFLAYDFNTHLFLAKADNKIELQEALAIRFPDKTFICSETNMNEVGFS